MDPVHPHSHYQGQHLLLCSGNVQCLLPGLLYLVRSRTSSSILMATRLALQAATGIGGEGEVLFPLPFLCHPMVYQGRGESNSPVLKLTSPAYLTAPSTASALVQCPGEVLCSLVHVFQLVKRAGPFFQSWGPKANSFVCNNR